MFDFCFGTWQLQDLWRCWIGTAPPPTSDFPAIGKDLAATQESLHTTQNSLSDCFNEVRVLFGALLWAQSGQSVGKGKDAHRFFWSEHNFYPKDPKVLKT